MEYESVLTPPVFPRSFFVDGYGIEMPRDVETSII